MNAKLPVLINIFIGAGLLSAFAADNPASPEDLKHGLILHYNFDTEAVDGKISDLSGKGNDGQAVNIKWVASGHQSGSVLFGLTNSYITVANNKALNSPQFTLAAWIKTSYKDWVWRRIFDKGTGHGYTLTMGGNMKQNTVWQGKVGLEVGQDWMASKNRVTDGEWHHVVGTYDGAELKLFVDGSPAGKQALTKDGPVPTMYDLTIGANRSNPNAKLGEVDASFNGMMDDVMMYDRALSLEEVQALFKLQGGVIMPETIKEPTAAPAAKPDAGERLKKLKSLFDQGLINKEDYDKKVKEIMDSL